MIVNPKFVFLSVLSVFSVGNRVAYAALSQSVNFTTQDSGYTLAGDGGAGVYGVQLANGAAVELSSTPTNTSVQPTGFSGNFLSVENPNYLNSTIYTLVPGATTQIPNAIVYVNLPTATGVMTSGSISFSFKLAAPNATVDRYDSATSGRPLTFVDFQYRVDGGAWQTAISVQGRGTLGNNINPASFGMWWDQNNDGLFTDGDIQILTAATAVSRTITGITIGSTLSTRIRLGSGVQDELAIDDIAVTSAQFSAVPEPTTYGMIGACALGGIAAVRRRRLRR